jgi:hypothetical protein
VWGKGAALPEDPTRAGGGGGRHPPCQQRPGLQIGDEITFNHPGRVILPGLPESLIAQPTLVWLLENSLGKTQTVEASYLTNGITWKADYVMTLNDKDTKADLAGWVPSTTRAAPPIAMPG